MYRLSIALFSIILLASCGNGENREDNGGLQEIAEPIQERTTEQWLIFEGEIPCIDCDKIEVTLWLEKDSIQETNDYRIRTVHRNTAQGDIEEELEGIYARLTGYRGDAEAVVYQLNPGTENPRYFWLQENGELRVLGADREKLVEDDEETGLTYDLQLRRED
ncbi:copper resistance protein NlpE N-terminal domain-containing protein [Litoribacter populi]|uniref:copper resistance protein NlpE N-terminal domain-containing protein n=1 Tax=Litoribacter populi TaxID=2598460 RepID=UPI0011810A51|nr:copper resistance protein NlpE N-terminal domain-containing protein [Litoribacter populi]